MGLRPYPRRVKPSLDGADTQVQEKPLRAELDRQQMRISIV